MKTLRYFIAIASFGLFGMSANAQDKVEATVGTDFVSQYIWRGLDCGNVSVQPTLGLGWKGLSLTAWGSVGLEASDTKEFDLTLGYSAGGFNVGVTDYWFNAGGDVRGRYFMYKAHGTNHVFEGNIGYDFGCLNVQWYTNFAGNDGVNKDGKRAYSSYFELAAPFTLAGLDWTATVGAVPFATTSYDTSGFAVTNIGVKAVKEFTVGKALTLPVFAAINANPCSQKAYFTVGFSIVPNL